MADFVLDASALLALILEEPGADLDAIVGRSVISAVNLTEVRTKLIDLEKLDIQALDTELRTLIQVEPFTEEQALLAADLRTATRTLGLSLGDRACLALGITLGSTVYTADRNWTRLNLDCEIISIR